MIKSKTETNVDSNIFYFISHEKDLGRDQMLWYTPLLLLSGSAGFLLFFFNVIWSNSVMKSACYLYMYPRQPITGQKVSRCAKHYNLS